MIGFLECRFNFLGNEFCAEITLLYPKNFNTVHLEGLKVPVFNKLCENLIRFEREISPQKLRDELANLTHHWKRLVNLPPV